MTLRQLREAAEMTQGQLAKLAGVEQTTVSQLELGKLKNPTYNTVASLARALGLGVEDVATAIAKSVAAAATEVA